MYFLTFVNFRVLKFELSFVCQDLTCFEQQNSKEGVTCWANIKPMDIFTKKSDVCVVLKTLLCCHY